MSDGKYPRIFLLEMEAIVYLLSNSSEYSPNNGTNIQRYCTVEILFAGQVGARTHTLVTLSLFQ